MFDRSHVLTFLVGVLAYYLYLKMGKGLITGPPWSPVYAMQARTG